MSQLRKRTALEAPSLGTIIKRAKPSDKTGNVEPIFIVTSQLSIIDGLPPLVQHALGGVALYEHWAIEVGGRYYELHRGVGRMWKGSHISTEDTVDDTARVVKDGCRELVGYTHDAEETLRFKAKMLEPEFPSYHLIWSNCHNFVLRFRKVIECCDCHDRIPMKRQMQTAEDFAGVVKVGSILVPAAFTPMAFVTGHYLRGSVLILASGYAAWHEKQARKARERLLESDNHYYWRAPALASSEPGNYDAFGLDIPALQESDHLPSEDREALGVFTRSLQDAASRAVPTPKDGGYSSVRVFLLYWDEDYSIVNTDLESLRDVFVDDYGYEVESFAIPSKDPFTAIYTRLTEFVVYNNDPEGLIIMYYCGDMILNHNREGCWIPRSREHYIHPILSMGFESLWSQSKSDILQLFDSCYASAALTASNQRTTSVMQLIAAASFEGHISQEDMSFTRSLAYILSSSLSSNTPISVHELHVRMLTQMNHLAPQNGVEWQKTPVHFTIQQQDAPRDILLAPLKPPPANLTIESDSSVQDASQILLSVRMQGPDTDENAWRKWLRAMPKTRRQEIRVEGVFMSG